MTFKEIWKRLGLVQNSLDKIILKKFSFDISSEERINILSSNEAWRKFKIAQKKLDKTLIKKEQ